MPAPAQTMPLRAVFGEPAEKGAWGWRVEGHHLSLNFTIKDGQLLRATPAFMGSNPGEIRQGPLTGLRVLAVEEEMGRELVKSLTPSSLRWLLSPRRHPRR